MILNQFVPAASPLGRRIRTGARRLCVRPFFYCQPEKQPAAVCPRWPYVRCADFTCDQNGRGAPTSEPCSEKGSGTRLSRQHSSISTTEEFRGGCRSLSVDNS